MPSACCFDPDQRVCRYRNLLMRRAQPSTALCWGAMKAQSVGIVRVCVRRTMGCRAEVGNFFGLPTVHEPRIQHHDGHKNQQRALCGHPKIKRPTMDFDGQIACKKTRPKTGQKPNRQQGPPQTVLTFFQRGRWRVNFRHAQGYAKTHGVCLRNATPIFGVYPCMQTWCMASTPERSEFQSMPEG